MVAGTVLAGAVFARTALAGGSLTAGVLAGRLVDFGRTVTVTVLGVVLGELPVGAAPVGVVVINVGVAATACREGPLALILRCAVTLAPQPPLSGLAR